MKKTIVLSLLICLAATATAQTDSVGYKSIFGHESTVWNGAIVDMDDWWYNYVLRSSIDTTIDELKYKKIECSRVYSHNENYGEELREEWKDILLREDTTTGKVWLRFLHDGGYHHSVDTDYLIMEMTLNIGDSFLLRETSGYVTYEDWYYVTNITNTGSLKKIHLQKGNNSLDFIEGVGCTNLFGIALCYNVSSTLRCCFKDGELVWKVPDSEYGDDCIIPWVSIENIEEEPSVFVSPNPACGTVTVHDTEEMTEIEVLDIFGSKVMAHKDSGLTAKLNVATLSRGTYMVRVTTAKGVATHKLLLR